VTHEHASGAAWSRAVARDIVGLPVVAGNGVRMGRVVDLELDVAEGFRVIAIEIGARGWLGRLRDLASRAEEIVGERKLRTVPWTDVERLEARRIVLRAGARPTRPSSREQR
jgi:sporulation protein YlmC with PRC-barrel domain